MADDTAKADELWPETRERIANLRLLYGCSTTELINRAMLVLEYATVVDSFPGREGVVLMKVDEQGQPVEAQGLLLR